MRILIVSAIFPPNVRGGAELSAHSTAKWFVAQGHTVGVLSAANDASLEVSGESVDGFTLWTRHMPRQYSGFDAAEAPALQKPYWHLQDHFDPRNRNVMAEILDAFRPDVIQIHYLQGIGYNALYEIGKRDIPTMYILHDLGLVCIRMAMYKRGQECASQCVACRLSTKVKLRAIRSVPRLGFCSPSRALLQKVLSLMPVGDYPTAHILNPNPGLDPTVARTTSSKTRLLYVGRLELSKGIVNLIDALSQIEDVGAFSLNVVGSGGLAEFLTETYGHLPWLSFAGQISKQDVINVMANSDLLCLPSQWFENSPGVVIEALRLGLPVIASDKGGIPELITDGENGLLLPADDAVAWRDTLQRVIADRSLIDAMRLKAAPSAAEFGQDHLGSKVLSFFAEIAAPSSRQAKGHRAAPDPELIDL